MSRRTSRLAESGVEPVSEPRRYRTDRLQAAPCQGGLRRFVWSSSCRAIVLPSRKSLCPPLFPNPLTAIPPAFPNSTACWRGTAPGNADGRRRSHRDRQDATGSDVRASGFGAGRPYGHLLRHGRREGTRRIMRLRPAAVRLADDPAANRRTCPPGTGVGSRSFAEGRTANLPAKRTTSVARRPRRRRLASLEDRTVEQAAVRHLVFLRQLRAGRTPLRDRRNRAD